ncbi:hypothetical protein [Cryobacterium sp. MDB2-10]|uniref:hypothetical protein n=1 Tax=Cryobacterium sp. MDB2-10 TaxID=1259177 RepID=UPI00107371A6|nr:hypothetical protein [Cryobacterium sp. MDB2-10]TFC19906.1 hypothetical protein E3O51_06095 [Cryobacterium sp. MDB2-10]
MSEPRYWPRDFSSEPESFGKARSVGWLPSTDDRSKALGNAARLQHMYAVRIRSRAKDISRRPVNANGSLAARTEVDKKAPLKCLAAKSGSSYTRLLGCLRGTVVMRLDDIAWADMVLGDIIEQRVQDGPGTRATGEYPRATMR